MGYPNRNAAKLRDLASKNSTNIIGSVGGMGNTIIALCDRVDELEWMIEKLREKDTEHEE